MQITFTLPELILLTELAIDHHRQMEALRVSRPALTLAHSTMQDHYDTATTLARKLMERTSAARIAQDTSTATPSPSPGPEPSLFPSPGADSATQEASRPPDEQTPGKDEPQHQTHKRTRKAKKGK